MVLYHFTDSRNLPSIKRYGLLSWQKLLQRNIHHWPASSEESRYYDSRKGLENYVRLCRYTNHPMANYALRHGRINDFVWLEISGDVLQWRATRYSNDNAVRNLVIINSDPRTALESTSIQAEIMVFESLNPRFIRFP